MNSVFVQRLIVFTALILIAFIAPWWLSLLGAFFVLIRFGWLEVTIIGVILDSLYGSANLLGFNIGFLYTGVLTALALLRPFIRTYFFPTL